MKKTTDSSTLHNSVMWSSQENLQENNTGANSMHTPSPQGAHKWNIVQSSPEEFDAVAGANSNIVQEFTWNPYHLHILIWHLEEIIKEKRAILDSIGYYQRESTNYL